MDRPSAIKIVQETFNSPFDKGRFVHFVRELFNAIDESPFIYRGNFIPDAYNPYIRTFERIGKYQDVEGNKIDILIVQLKKESSLEHARTMQRNFVAWYLNGSRGGELKDAAVAAFVAPNSEDWRFSLVKMEYRFAESKDGKINPKQELTPARRWSFLVGRNENSHTAQKQLLPILQDDQNDPLLSQLESAFSVEVVTKEFFEKYRELFLKTKESLDEIIRTDSKVAKDFKEKDIDTVNFAKKLLGQIVFLYFLQKKGWFGVQRDADWGTGPKNFLRQLLDSEHGKYTNFFNDILEPLFYEALAVERSEDFYSRFNCKIPFLNGGLFDPINGYDWVHTDIYVPNELFSNDSRTKEGDKGTGILDVFDRYNFTVKEDEPLEKEVAVDPEMLGKVFENLLEVKDRKSKGTYYTPREIVHYMCQESLISYLYSEVNHQHVFAEDQPSQSKLFGKPDPEQTKLTSDRAEIVLKQDIDTLIRYGETAVEHDALYVEKFTENPEYKGKYDKAKLPKSVEKNAQLIDEKLSSIRVCDPAVGSGAFLVGMMNEIVRTRNALTHFIEEKEGRTIYDLKRHAIQNCLYGVDIDPGAIEVGKLRLWLSLVVDEEDIKQIKPLPNLDYKIVCGNSLLGFPYTPQGLEKIEQLKHQFFGETRSKVKEELRKQIENAIRDLFADTVKSLGYEVQFDFKIFFSEVFHEEAGFDIVIANPPYIDSESMVKSGMEDLRQAISRTYRMTRGNWDIYIAFFERGFNILNKTGVLTFITPDKWISKPFGNDLRKATIGNIYAIAKAGREVFESVNVDSIISFFQRIKSKKLRILSTEDNTFVSKREIEKQLLKSPFAFDYLFSDHLELLLKIESIPNKISDLGNCENACATSDAYKLEPLIKDSSGNTFDPRKQLKVINTGTIGKYFLRWGNREMTYLRHKYLCPIVDKTKFLNLFQNTYGSKSLKSKIIIKGLNLLDACLDLEGNVIPGKSTLILANEDASKLELLLAILNSRLASFYIKERYPSSSYNQGTTFTKDMINDLPVPEMKGNDQKSLVNLVEDIMTITSSLDYSENKEKQSKVEKLRNQIDQIVYKLYGLTEEEIKIVEGNN